VKKLLARKARREDAQAIATAGISASMARATDKARFVESFML